MKDLVVDFFLANNLLVYINDVLQKPVIDYNFDKGTRITFNDAPKRGSKIRMYLYVASRDDYFDVDIDETIKPGDTVRIQPNLPTSGESVPYDMDNDSMPFEPNTFDTEKKHPSIDPSNPSQEDRIVYELISSPKIFILALFSKTSRMLDSGNLWFNGFELSNNLISSPPVILTSNPFAPLKE